MNANLIDLGWHNAGGETAKKIDKVVAECCAKKHTQTDKDMGPPFRGLDHLVTCIECGYRYHYDSSG